MNSDKNYNEQPDSIDAIKSRLSRIEEERRQLVASLEKLQRNSASSISDSNTNIAFDPLTAKNKSLFSPAVNRHLKCTTNRQLIVHHFSGTTPA
ncbi:MAG: hypothetical protein PHP01_09200 [Phycisphaerae bacterium]|nr:hypothetical protein [Phycisphaerae bacterium]